jgi:antitoxin component YwqK of YwqJK toxin-antitoxin module
VTDEFRNGGYLINLKNGFIHDNDDNPAIVHYYNDGKVRWKGWYKNGICHRSHPNDDLPAEIFYYDDGKIRYEVWLKNGKFHRYHPNEDLPAIIRYHNIDDQYGIKKEEWYMNGSRYRKDNLPTMIEYYKNGKIKSEEWHCRDICYKSKTYRTRNSILSYYNKIIHIFSKKGSR